jgi:hypothetical protein
MVKMRRECLEENGQRFCSTSERISSEDSQILQPYLSHEGIRIEDWMNDLDAIVVLETALLNVFLLAKSLKIKKSVLVLNMDWTDPSQVQI